MGLQKQEKRAGELYRAYLGKGNGDPEDGESTIVDMVADLLLLARSLDFDTDRILRLAQMHYDAEVAEHLAKLT